jgi:replicative DNA helicase
MYRYTDTKSSHTYTGDDLDKLLQRAQHQKVMLISDRTGMGKIHCTDTSVEANQTEVPKQMGGENRFKRPST